MAGCDVCKHPKASEVMAKVFAGDYTYVKAAEELELPIPSVWKCMKEHWNVERDGNNVTLKAVQKAETMEDFVFLMRKAVQKFIVRLNTAFESPVTQNENAVTKLSAELRALMRDILEFQGKLQSGPIIQLNLIQVQMNKLTSYLFSELCEADKQKLLKVLPDLMKSEGQPIEALQQNV